MSGNHQFEEYTSKSCIFGSYTREFQSRQICSNLTASPSMLVRRSDFVLQMETDLAIHRVPHREVLIEFTQVYGGLSANNQTIRITSQWLWVLHTRPFSTSVTRN